MSKVVKRISIIIPAYNAEKYIERCIISCLNQNYENIEVLVINDGSKDNTLKICEKLAKQYNSLKVFTKKNSGVSDTRNYGIDKSTGDYIMFVDADDYIEDDMCSKLITHMDDHSDLVVCGYYLQNRNSQKTQNINADVSYNRIDFLNALLTMQNQNLLYVCWNKLYKRQKIQTYFPLDMTFGEDSIFNFSYIQNCQHIKIIDYIGYHYIVGNNLSAMNRYHPNMLDMLIKEYDSISKCLSSLNENILFAQNHLIDNIFFFFLPQLLRTNIIDSKEKKSVLAKLSRNKDVIKALNTYKYKGKKQKVIAISIKYRLKFLLDLMYMEEEK